MSMPALYKAFPGEWNSWRGMRERCANPKHISYRWYGAVGVTVHPEWNASDGFPAFLEHIGPKPSPEMVLDRIDSAKGYVPGNVRWVSPLESTRNRRRQRMPATLITIDGETRTVQEWAARTGLRAREIRRRLSMGLSPRGAVMARSVPEGRAMAGGEYVHPRDMPHRRHPYRGNRRAKPSAP